jgi:F-box/leucine-rich repeat protein 2/20
MVYETGISVLMDLPEAVLASILSSWMTATHVARLDSALCTSKFRSIFQSSAYGPRTVLTYPEVSGVRDETLCALTMWTLKKGAAMSMLRVTTGVLDHTTLLASHLITCGKTVSIVRFQYDGMDARTEAVALMIAGFCPNVSSFQCNCTLTDHGLLAIAVKCTLLKKVKLFGSFGDKTIDVIANHCYQLTSIALMTSTALSEIALVRLLNKNPKLESIRMMEGATFLTDRFPLELAASCTNITSVDLCKTDLSDVGITALATKCLKLHHLDIAHCRFRATNARSAVAFQALHTLGLFHLTAEDADLDFLLSCCPSVQSLNLIDLWDVTDRGLHCVANRCPLLHKLWLWGSSRCRGSATDAFLDTIGGRCSALRTLRLSSCLNVSDTGVCSIIRACRCLEVFELTDNLRITDDVLYALAERGSVLKGVYLSFCEGITSAGLQAFRHSCPAVKLYR